MADLFIPILIIIAMYILIDVIDGGLALGCIAVLFALISIVMHTIISGGGFDKLFGATITTSQAGFLMIPIFMGTASILALGKIIILRRSFIASKKADVEED